MGFLDRFSKDTPASPDAFTIEVVARIRALPNVERAEPIDADTVSITWSGWNDPEAADISGPRQPWKAAKGFDRIELLDDFIAGLAPGQFPPAGREAEPELEPATPAAPLPPLPQRRPAAAQEDAGAEPATAPPYEPLTEWSQVAAQLVPVLRRARPSDGTVTWPIGTLLEGTAIWAGGATPITTDQCTTWGVELEEVRAAAVANLVAIDPAPDEIGPGSRAWVPTSPDGLQSSWLAAPERLLQAVGLSSAIVLVPLRSELVVVDPADVELVTSILANTITILETQAGVLCPVPFLVQGNDVESWMPAPDHPAAELVRQTRDLLTR